MSPRIQCGRNWQFVLKFGRIKGKFIHYRPEDTFDSAVTDHRYNSLCESQRDVTHSHRLVRPLRAFGCAEFLSPFPKRLMSKLFPKIHQPCRRGLFRSSRSLNSFPSRMLQRCRPAGADATRTAVVSGLPLSFHRRLSISSNPSGWCPATRQVYVRGEGGQKPGKKIIWLDSKCPTSRGKTKA